MKKNVFVTGLKLALLSIIIGAVSWFINAFLFSLGLIFNAVMFWIVIVLIMLFLSVFIGGWLAQKMWKWK